MRGHEGLSQHIVDPGTLKAVVDTSSVSHLPDHLHINELVISPVMHVIYIQVYVITSSMYSYLMHLFVTGLGVDEVSDAHLFA